MKYIVDECTGPAIAKWLAELGYEVFSIYDESPGIKDEPSRVGYAYHVVSRDPPTFVAPHHWW